MLKDLSRRVISSLFFIALVVCAVVFAFHEWMQWMNALLVASLTGIAVWEFAQFGKAKGGKMILPFLVGASVAEVFSFFLSVQDSRWGFVPIAIFFISFLTLFALHFKDKEGAIVDLSVSLFPLLYIAIPLGMLLATLYLEGQDGRWWVAYLLFVTKITDIGAYFAGSLWGKRKLAPHISPSKTIEGALFGLVLAVFSSFGFRLVSQTIGAVHFELGTIEWLILGLILGVTGQFSDLSESLLKRDANKKDSNKLPGLGGVLDAVDSLLFNAPIVYLYLFFLKV